LLLGAGEGPGLVQQESGHVGPVVDAMQRRGIVDPMQPQHQTAGDQRQMRCLLQSSRPRDGLDLLPGGGGGGARLLLGEARAAEHDPRGGVRGNGARRERGEPAARCELGAELERCSRQPLAPMSGMDPDPTSADPLVSSTSKTTADPAKASVRGSAIASTARSPRSRAGAATWSITARTEAEVYR